MKWATVVFISMLAYSSIVSAQHTTGSQLLQWCQAGEPVGEITERLACYGYLHGMWETFDIMVLLFPPGSKTFCLPSGGMAIEQVRLIVVKWFRDHPERIHEWAVPLAINALKDAFPCAADKPGVQQK